MPGGFDPYHTWLAIPPEKQPPNHYDLLGLPLFEDIPEVIEAAADRQMGHLRTYQTGKHGKLSQKLLNEVAAARVCLLNPEKKAAYDHKLRSVLRTAPQRPSLPAAQRPSLPAAQRPSLSAVLPKPAGRKPPVQAATQTADFSQLGEYRLLEKLGEGGMGAVYKALHTKLGREVALKVLPKGRIEDQRTIARFEREMMAVGRLDHPNIVRAYDAREIKGTRFLVMEFVDGLDLKELVRRDGPLAVADACELIRQAALGLQCAHEHGLVHRDVKSSNLMLSQAVPPSTRDAGQVKLLDLGLARFQADQPAGEEMTATGQAMGTLDYMAPEQISDTHTVDIRADIYGLGCTLYKLLTGRAPFEGPEYQTAFDKMQGHLEKPVPSIRKLRGDVPKELAAVVNRMLAKDPARRFATPAEVADAVGPLSAASDLPGLLGRAKRKPPIARPSKSLVATAGSLSSGMTRFFQRIKLGGRAAAGPPSAADESRRTKLPVILGAVGVALLLLVGVVIWGLFVAGKPPQEAVLVFDWPVDVRGEVKLLIDGKRARLPSKPGPMEYPCEPGEHRIVADRPGYKRYEQTVTVEIGRQVKISVEWQRQSHLVLNWPAVDRRGATLEIDGNPYDISAPASRRDRNLLKVPLEAGPHKLRIARAGFEPFEDTVTISEGKDADIEPVWKPVTKVVETDKKHPVPSEAAQQAVAEQIDNFYHFADADTATKKRELAGKLLARAGQAEKDPTERYVLLHNAVELATEGCDRALVLRAVEALAGHFEMDASQVKQKALERIAAIEEAQRQAREAAERTKQEAAKRAEAEKRYADALRPAEEKVAAWDFRRAAEVLAKLDFDEEDLSARLDARREEVQRLVDLKHRMIEKINTVEPRLQRKGLHLPGIPATAILVKADQQGIIAKLNGGKTKSHYWHEFGDKTRERLLKLVIDPNSGDDWIAAGLLTLTCGDAVLADRLFAKARTLGADTDRYLAKLAGTTFARATKLLRSAQSLMERQLFSEARVGFSRADEALEGVEDKYGKIPWFASNKKAFDAARAEARHGIREANAEEEYATASELFDQQELFDLKFQVDKLKTDYAETRAVTSPGRKPSFAELEKAVAGLTCIIVRQDGKREEAQSDIPVFKSIQAAIDAAPPKAWIQIRDSGEYSERIVIPKEKSGLTIQGRKGCWPVITSWGHRKNFPTLVQVDAPETALQRLLLIHGTPFGEVPHCLAINDGSLRLRWVLVWMPSGDQAFWSQNEKDCDAENCIFLGSVFLNGQTRFRNCVFKAHRVTTGHRPEIRFCTFDATLNLNSSKVGALLDSIVFGQVSGHYVGNRIANCNVYNEYAKSLYGRLAKPGPGCFSAHPRFVNRAELDFRLQEKDADGKRNRCLTAASDGGAVGCRFTPETFEALQMLEMLEMAKKALERRP